MSIASASLVPTLPVNGIQFLNPALNNVILATNANGVVKADSAGSVLSNPVVTENPNTVIDTPSVSNCQILQIGKLVNFATSITFNIGGAGSIPSGGKNYVFEVPAFPPIQSTFTGTNQNIPYNFTYSLTQPNTESGGDINILSTDAFINIQNFGSGAGAYTGIALNDMDFSSPAVTTESCTLIISGFYFAQ